MAENFLFREDPKPTWQPVPVPQKPIHIPSLVLGILSVLTAVLFPLVGLVLGFIGRVTEADKAKTHGVIGGRICCNVGMGLAGFALLLNLLAILAAEM